MPKRRRRLDVVCPNESCVCFNKKGERNIVKNGKKGNRTQNYICRECGTQFVRTKGTIFYHKKLKRKEVASMCRHFVETNSFRGIAREMQHNKNTICSYADIIAKQCEEVNNFLIKDVKLGTHEIDELWTYVKKKKQNAKKLFSATRKKGIPIAT